MSDKPSLLEITPTVCLSGPEDALRQLVRVRVGSPVAACAATLQVNGAVCGVFDLPSGEATFDALIPEVSAPTELAFVLLVNDAAVDQKRVAWRPLPHLRVHLVQHSHHDVGYTNLPSTVLREHCRFLAEALEMADGTAAYPEDAQLRLVIEQAWSLQEFLRTATAGQTERMTGLLRRGDFELTALFGNMTTEICGPEELLRALYPSQRIARRLGFPITTAEHNDVPGMSWGLAQVLSEAGIRLFTPQLPRYWSWCDPPLQHFWEEATLFPQGLPGGFWWEAPSGRRVLLWDAYGTGGDIRPDLPLFADRLGELVGKGYPYRSVYWPVRGGARDNSPYIAGFAETARNWNEQWAYPRLIVSTNARFEADLRPELGDLPVFRGELPGQDYPVGSTSTAAATGVNRRNQVQLLVAERLATLAGQATDHQYPTDALDRAYEDVLWYDEHTWGHHFPAGPAAEASQFEKQVHAYRAAAVAHDVTVTGMARLADAVGLPGQGLYLVVFNPLPHQRTAPVCTSLREIENCGSTMTLVTDPQHPEQPGYLRGMALTNRWHVHPSGEIVAGKFDLIDVETGATVDFQITDVGLDDPVPYSAQRYGLAQGGKRYGVFETPSGLAKDLRFVARDLPSCGYRTYELRPWAGAAPSAGPVANGATPTDSSASRSALIIENEFYRLQADRDSGRVISLIDIEADRELLDGQEPHGLGELVVRTPENAVLPTGPITCRRGQSGGVYQSLEFVSSAPGHPSVRQVVSLQAGVKRVDLAVRLLKDPTPLLDVHLAFPFAVPEPSFRHESTLALQTPIADYLPGAYWDEVAVQNWVRVRGGGISLLWSSLEAPMVSLGGLSAGYTSPAHSAMVSERLKHQPAGPEQLSRGWLYSLLCYNNLGTNFAVSQCGSLLFRYSFTTQSGEMTDAEAVRLGWEAVMPPETIFTDARRPGHLPPTLSLLSLEGDPLVLLACRQADTGNGVILRLWNPTEATAETTVRLAGVFETARLVSVTEDGAGPIGGELMASDHDGFGLRLGPRSLATAHVTMRSTR